MDTFVEMLMRIVGIPAPMAGIVMGVLILLGVLDGWTWGWFLIIWVICILVCNGLAEADDFLW